MDTYGGMWRAYQAALALPDPAHPDLTKYATGEALKTLTSGVQSVKDQGLRGEGQFVTAPRVVGAAPANSPTEVEISDCIDTSGSRLVRAGAGAPYSDPPGGKRRALATVKRQADGGWKVDSFAVRDVGSC